MNTWVHYISQFLEKSLILTFVYNLHVAAGCSHTCSLCCRLLQDPAGYWNFRSGAVAICQFCN